MARWATFQHFCDSLYVYSKPHPSLIFSFGWNSPWALNKLCLSTSYDWLTTACDLWRPILIELARCSHQTQPQTLQWESLRSAALIWKSALFEQSREPFWSSNRSRDQLCKQRLVRIKCRAPLCHCHNEEENTTYHLLLRGNWSGWSRSNKKNSLQWRWSFWKTGVSEVCCWSHGQRKQLLEENSVVRWKNGAVWPQWAMICLEAFNSENTIPTGAVGLFYCSKESQWNNEGGT